MRKSPLTSRLAIFRLNPSISYKIWAIIYAEDHFPIILSCFWKTNKWKLTIILSDKWIWHIFYSNSRLFGISFFSFWACFLTFFASDFAICLESIFDRFSVSLCSLCSFAISDWKKVITRVTYLGQSVYLSSEKRFLPLFNLFLSLLTFPFCLGTSNISSFFSRFCTLVYP